ncbi:RecB-like exonuclease [Mycobacterium phage Orange]|nr:nuclease [Mycobacterium phage Snape]QBI97898.1 RecB-like exonuclease [Mycobacterium phage Orange]QBI98271.1 RecB-like exonuclease [Mycobacterium phage Bowtie]QGZ16486.1 RecB-like exonuclease/helicase [Mycobacterium phage Aneem]QPX61996.1 Cas4 family exonuclease [Mycobacterium phage Flaverint]UAW09328.1 Cas4 family exonuclease [Mycobacterium phage Timothy]UXE05116.1 Cas4 family exonuclease [Mycobacterium phage MaCh]
MPTDLTRNEYKYEKKPRSVSQLSQFDKCPFSWKLARHERVWKRPAAWLPQGTAFHTVAETYEKRRNEGNPMTLEEAMDLFRFAEAHKHKEPDRCIAVISPDGRKVVLEDPRVARSRVG